MTEYLPKKVRTTTLSDFKAQGHKFSCLTSYDSLTAGIFDESGIDVLLVGDSASDNALGYDSTLPITVDEMISFGRAVASSTTRALVVVDMPFGSYETGPVEALANGLAIIKRTGAAAVKLEGGRRSVPQIEVLVQAGVPVMGHLGFTPQSVNTLGGFKIQGRSEKSAQDLLDDALALQTAGVFAIVFEMVPAPLAAEITAKLEVPTIGIGAGNQTDGQILVWTDFAGLTGRKPRTFVKQYAQLREALAAAASAYKSDVETGAFPDESHSFKN